MTVSTAVPSHHEVPMTREGYERLHDELATLTTTARAEITDRLRAAREDGGELADNLELIDALEDQDLLERRIRCRPDSNGSWRAPRCGTSRCTCPTISTLCARGLHKPARALPLRLVLSRAREYPVRKAATLAL